MCSLYFLKTYISVIELKYNIPCFVEKPLKLSLKRLTELEVLLKKEILQ